MEDEIIIIFMTLVICAIDYYLASEFYNVAKMKGYYEKKYLYISFIFTLVGYLLILSLPNKSDSEKKKSLELPEI